MSVRIAHTFRRRGMTVLLVLGVLAITLAVCYATLRGQGATAQLARNNSRSLQAREASYSGLAAALRKMSESSWTGVDVPLTAHITGDSWFEVSYSTGDPALTVGSAQYGEYPYRVTIDSIGYASDPSDPSVRSIHKCRCIAQLIRKALLPEPAIWPTLQASTLYQWGNRNIYVQEPVRINGKTTLLGKLFLSTEYPLTSASRDRYLTDLSAMKNAGRGDYRPFENPFNIALVRQDAATLTQLTTRLGLTPIDALDSTNTPLSHPSSVSSYQLYPGGKSYSLLPLQTIYASTTLSNVTLGPDPVSNPAGLFRSSGTLILSNNVRMTGTLLTETGSSDLQISGTNVVLQAATLPKLSGSNVSYQLPLALIRDNLTVNALSESKFTGFTMVWDDFEIKRGGPATQLTMLGNVTSQGVLFRGRDTWTMSATAWNADYNDYMGTGGLLAILLNALFDTIRAALGIPSGQPVYFPEYMQYQRGFNYKPILTFQQDSSGVQPHWHDWTKPIYQKGPGDEGLCWDVIRWEDNL